MDTNKENNMSKLKIFILILIALLISLFSFFLVDKFILNKNSYLSSSALIEIYSDNILLKKVETKSIGQFLLDLNLVKGDVILGKNEDAPKYTINVYKKQNYYFNKNEKEEIKINVYNDSEFIELNNNLTYKTNNKLVNLLNKKYNFTDLKNPFPEPIMENIKVTQVAAGEIGNVGGEPYWRWYGLNHRIEWCCVFVSWVGYKTGFLQAGEIPKFPNVSAGVNFYKNNGKWKDKTYIPSPGDIIFFDYLLDNRAYHVGIVEKVENGRIYTIEGNHKDTVSRLSYPVGSPYIYGYGTPDYRVKKPDYLK